MRPVVAFVAGLSVAVAVVGAFAAGQRTSSRPKLEPDPMLLPRPEPQDDERPLALASAVTMTAQAEPEKRGKPSEVCGYGEREDAPCWCYARVGDTGFVRVTGDTYTDCDNSRAYTNSVFKFGPPPAGIVVDIRSPF